MKLKILSLLLLVFLISGCCVDCLDLEETSNEIQYNKTGCPDYQVAVIIRNDDFNGNNSVNINFDGDSINWVGFLEFVYAYYSNFPKVKLTVGVMEPQSWLRKISVNYMVFQDQTKPHQTRAKSLFKYLDKVGWELASHTKTHSNLSNLTEEEIYDEVCNFKTEVEKYVDQEIVTLIYPNGDYDERVITIAKSCGYKIGAIGSNEDGVNFTTIPEDKFRWGYTIESPYNYPLEHLNGIFDSLYNADNKSVVNYYLHWWNLDQYEDNSSWSKHLHYIENKKGVWFTTYRELYERCGVK